MSERAMPKSPHYHDWIVADTEWNPHVDGEFVAIWVCQCGASKAVDYRPYDNHQTAKRTKEAVTD